MRGFTLIEMLVTVVILGVMAGIAVPLMSPMVDLEQLRSATVQAAEFAGRARTRAITDRRCVRVRIDPPRTLIAERLNTFDCEDPAGAIAAAGTIDGTASQWIEVERQPLDTQAITVIVKDSGEAPAGEIRFRPNGRLFSANNSLTDDESRFRVTHSDLPAGDDYREVGIFSQGTFQISFVGADASAVGQDTL